MVISHHYFTEHTHLHTQAVWIQGLVPIQNSPLFQVECFAVSVNKVFLNPLHGKERQRERRTKRPSALSRCGDQEQMSECFAVWIRSSLRVFALSVLVKTRHRMAKKLLAASLVNLCTRIIKYGCLYIKRIRTADQSIFTCFFIVPCIKIVCCCFEHVHPQPLQNHPPWHLRL